MDAESIAGGAVRSNSPSFEPSGSLRDQVPDVPEMPEFAPPDAEYFDDDPMEIDL